MGGWAGGGVGGNSNTGCLCQIKQFKMPEMKPGYQLYCSVRSSSWRGELAIFKMA